MILDDEDDPLLRAVAAAPPLPPPTRAWTPPERFDEYRLLGPIGRGAMGQVYLAHDTLLDRSVAVKFLGAAFHSQEKARRRFLIEARAIARLQHPNVVAVHCVGEADGQPYFVAEFVRGKPLSELPKPVPSARVLSIAIGLARGLAAAHRHGVLHRDVKPANLILQDDGGVKLLDFGLAKFFDDSAVSGSNGPQQPVAAQSPLTVVGTIVGTPHYMAPESLRGAPATRRSDVYSVGAVLYELCTGRLPREATRSTCGGTTAEGTPAPLDEPPPVSAIAPDVDPGLAAIISRCIKPQPELRFASADELRDALEQLRPVPHPTAIPEGNPYRGLHPFEAEHRSLFFGRNSEIRALLERLRSEPLVVVAGDSGVGKSSLCRGGALPLIADGFLDEHRHYAVASLVPGRRPLAALASALAGILATNEEPLAAWLRSDPSALGRALRRSQGAAAATVIFVDQLEELFTISPPDEAALFGEILGRLATDLLPGVRVLAAVRGDFFVRLAQLPALGQEASHALFLLRPMGPECMREAVVGPARAKGVSFESEALVDTLVESASATAGGLPLLQFTLAELWEARDQPGRHILSSSLDAIGGVAGALARHADGVLAGLLPEQGRLLVARELDGEIAYEVAHEALLQGWDTLRRWLDADAEERQIRHRIEGAAAEWARLGRPREALWSARQLDETARSEGLELGAREDQSGPQSPRRLPQFHAVSTRQRDLQ